MDDEDLYIYENRSDKKYKKRKPKAEGSQAEEEDVYFTTRDPFQFIESVVYYHENVDAGIKTSVVKPSDEDFQYEVLADQENIFPLGYPTEQYMSWVKNDVHRAFAKLKEEKKQALAALKRDVCDVKPGSTAGGNSTAATAAAVANVPDQDPGILDETRKNVEQGFKMFSSQFDIKVTSFSLIKDTHYNSLRIMFKDSHSCVIRPEMPLPKEKKPKSNKRGDDSKKVDLD